ncbi:uncharacterized protein Z519_11259 [Cladophialophora bantiana CBS 173.52]|uniref:DUF2278 domain-containing protein n=1 Tax=Cladophialophora bantiana (strain ATCC 10958 / CBS 173.52 / CDC B-1940 / NIH 8579) TaxID=1442370 RepID=A0A0D2H4D8_CLAB1|nr:uncharacterized protein Z519_11259 [Cladophialophora bantiana CBS 173.52]KIW88148.1 hypothetical protein Z519_11259 [Cladophialophora bantiana CBS 173.52]
MTIPHYGVWKGIPVAYRVDPPNDPSPHINLVFTDDKNGTTERKAAINVKSQSTPNELVYWFDHDFSHPLTRDLERLGLGFRHITANDLSTRDLALDYDRTDNLLHMPDGRILPFTESGPDNDILDQLIPILDGAIEKQAKIYLYGSSFGSGIHDVHMNQGSVGFPNGVGQDGAFFLRFPDGHWEAVFLAFASQRIPTNDRNGQPLSGSPSLERIIKASGRARL